MILSATTDKLTLTTNEAADVDVVTTYVDRSSSTGVVGEAGQQRTTITSATTTDIVAAPASSTTRKVKHLIIRNTHASASSDVCVNYNANGTVYEFFGARLYPGDKLEFDESTGFHVVKSARPRFRFFGYQNRDEVLYLPCTTTPASDTVSSIIPTCVAQLPPRLQSSAARRYGIFAWYTYVTAANTTGIRVGVVQTTSSTLGAIASVQVVTPSTSAATMSASSSSITDLTPPNVTAGPGSSGGAGFLSAAGADDNGPSNQTVNQSIALAFASEVSGSYVRIYDVPFFEVFENTD